MRYKTRHLYLALRELIPEHQGVIEYFVGNLEILFLVEIVQKRLATRRYSSIDWFYRFKLHIAQTHRRGHHDK